MRLSHLVLSTVFVLSGITAIAQTPIDPTGKRFIKPRERTPYGGPTHSTHAIPSSPENVNITFLEIQIDPGAKGGIDITARGTKTPKVRGCDDCAIAGRIIINGEATKEVESVTNDEGYKTKQEKNQGACRRVSFRDDANNEYAVVTNPEGGFMLNTIPNGTYSIWVGNKKVITNYVLKSIEPTPEQLKMEQDMREKHENQLKQAQKEEKH